MQARRLTEVTDNNPRSDHEFLEKVLQKVHTYSNYMDYAKIKDGLKTVMELSSLCNKFMTDNWTQKIDMQRKQVVVATLVNAIRVVACLFEPFMPSFSAMIYFFLGIERSLADESFIETLLKSKPHDLISLVKGGQQMNQPIPIFRLISDEEIIRHKQTFTPKDLESGSEH
jgi:methionyl-tRNA synthetase